ncbi:MAG TPA: hypothetical protein ENF73_04160 [Proteobacteria bacterium]|nr:hypothetical protein [Pseudomonadota bacterium]
MKTIVILLIIGLVVGLFAWIFLDWQPFGPKYSWDNVKKGFLPQKQRFEEKRKEYYEETIKTLEEAP